LAAALESLSNPRKSYLINAYGDYVGSADFNDEPCITEEEIAEINKSQFSVNQAWADEKDEFQNDAVADLNELYETTDFHDTDICNLFDSVGELSDELEDGKRAVNAQADVLEELDETFASVINRFDDFSEAAAADADNFLAAIKSLADTAESLCHLQDDTDAVVDVHANQIDELQDSVDSHEDSLVGLNTRMLELEFANLAERIAVLEAKADLPLLQTYPLDNIPYYNGPAWEPTITPVKLDATEDDVEFAASKERLAKALAERKAASSSIVQDFDKDK
jgi:hypothetical protein